MSLQVIDRGKVMFSADGRYVYLRTGHEAKRFEELLEDYVGETIVLCVERPDKVDDPELMIERQFAFVAP